VARVKRENDLKSGALYQVLPPLGYQAQKVPDEFAP